MIRIGSVPHTPARTGVRLTTGSTSVGHLHHDRVGVAEGHQPGQRPVPGHAEPSGVVDHDQVDAAGFFELGGDARARPAADDRQAL